MSKYATEFVGTFFLVLAIGCSVHLAGALSPIAIGLALTALVYMGFHASGAHYNPAVTVAVLIRGRCDRADVLPYIAAQLLGAVAGALVAYLLVGDTFAPGIGAGYSAMPALANEVLHTFLLVIVILNVATLEVNASNSYYGIAIGFTVAGSIFAGDAISGAAYNPAVGLGGILVNATMGTGDFGDLWLPVVGPLLGAVAAAGFFRIQHPQA